MREHGVEVGPALEFCTNEKQFAVICLLWSKGVKEAEVHDEWLPSMDRTVCHNKVYAGGSVCLKVA
jgi:hypothetical protein